MSKLMDELKMDLGWMNLVDGRPVPVRWGWVRVFLRAWTNRCRRAVLFYRLAHRARGRGGWIVRRWLAYRMFRSCGCEISPEARIAGGLLLAHPQGVIIGGAVEIGEMTRIGQFVTIGGNSWKRNAEGRTQPRIGANCLICAGAIVAGPIEVGESTIVGANAVVIRSVPPRHVVGGVPAKVLRQLQPNEPLCAAPVAPEPPSSPRA